MAPTMMIEILKLLTLVTICLTFVNSEIFRAQNCVQSNSCHSHDFKVSDSAHPHDNITLSFAVKLKNIEKVYQIVDEVSDPTSPNYGKHWSFEKLAELTYNSQAKSSVVNHLLKFVEESQLSSTPFGSFVRVETDIKTAQKILKAQYKKFNSPKTGQVVVRTLEFELPDEVSQSVDFISPTTQFPPTNSHQPLILSSSILLKKEGKEGEGEQEQSERASSGIMTPSVLNSFYNISSNTVRNPRATQSIFASLSQSFSSQDLSTFQNYFRIPLDSVDKTIGTNSGTTCASNPNNCMEASLDIQYILSIAQSAPTTFWSVSSSTSFSSWLETVASTPNPPLVHSISYGSIEEQTSSTEQQRFSQEAAKLGAQGVTIVVASGDDGVANYGARTSSSYCGFHPSYPANVPYILSVGASMGPESGALTEKACQSDQGSSITTGGGFSTIFPRPQYQSAAVAQYLLNNSTTICPALNLFASNGRGYPDVAMAGNNYQVVIGGKGYVVSGTSASAPVFAGIITLVNNARLNLGKSSLGFVNPALYQLFSSQPSLFKDITSGNNRCAALNQAGIPPVCCQNGFTCTKGWDPVTGLGSVNVGRLIGAMVQL